MMTWRKTAMACLASALLAPLAWGQAPTIPPPPPPVVPAAAPAPAPANLFSFLFPSHEQCAKVKDCLCNSPIGEMAKSFAKPMTMASGGLLFSKCGVPTAEDLKKLADAGKAAGPEGAAATIQKSEAEAAARRAAVRYLGTVDCNYWPEAKAALIAALRGDPNECVRFEAALALGRGCCCNIDTMTALKHTVNGEKDKFGPAERSDRVRAAASDALANCLSVFQEEVAPGAVEKEKAVGKVDTFRRPTPHAGVFGIFTNAAAQTATMPRGVVTASTTMPASLGVPAATFTRGFVVLEEEQPVQPASATAPSAPSLGTPRR